MAAELDLIVLGSGPGGYVAALRAAELGLRTLVVEKDPQFGGTCLHRGCIPTKALLHTAEILDQIRRASRFGVQVGEPALDHQAISAYKQRVIQKNAKGIEFLFRKQEVDSIRGVARMIAPGRVAVQEEGQVTELEARHVLLATGSRPQILPFAPVDGRRVLDSTQILELAFVPNSLAILGAGAVGVEFASIFTSFGGEVTLVEALPRILPQEDQEISASLERILRKRGIRVLTETLATSVEADDVGVALGLDQNGTEVRVNVEHLLVAIGRRPNTQGLGLQNIGIELGERGHVSVDRFMRTTEPKTYAIGDLVDTQQLAHLASAEGILAVEHIAGLEPRPIDYEQVPACTYCDPQVASVGLTEAVARDRYDDVAVAKSSFAASGKAAILDRQDGFIKIVKRTEDDQLLGVHILGAEATELIAEACLALGLESTTEEIFRTVHAHPTLSESMMEAARSAGGARDRG